MTRAQRAPRDRKVTRATQVLLVRRDQREIQERRVCRERSVRRVIPAQSGLPARKDCPVTQEQLERWGRKV